MNTNSANSSSSDQKLNEILKISRENVANNLRTMCVFDLDSTLFNVSTRTQRIIYEFAELHQVEELKNVEVLAADWGIKEAVIRAGFHPEQHPELLKKLRDYWFEHFFSNDYLHYDVPYAGAIAFVLELAATKAEIKYLTGRDQHRMSLGTKDVLRKWGFPCEDEQLILKPNRTIEDESYKRDWFQSFDRSCYAKIYFFENEPVNVNAVLKTYTDIEVVYLDTTHSRKQTVTEDILKIPHFHRQQRKS